VAADDLPSAITLARERIGRPARLAKRSRPAGPPGT